MIDKLKSLFKKINPKTEVAENNQNKLLFVFQGRYSHLLGAGKTLYFEESVFRNTLNKCNEVVQTYFGIDFIDSYYEENSTEKYDTAQNEFRYVVSSVAIQMALFDLWNEYGVKPDAATGLSGGEIACTYALGANTLQDAMLVASVIAEIATKPRKGRVLYVETDFKTALEICQNSPIAIYIFGNMDSKTTMLFCDEENLEKVLEVLSNHKLDLRVLAWDIPYHTPLVASHSETILEVLKHLKPNPLGFRYYSTVTGKELPPQTMMDADYWYELVREPFQFGQAVSSAIRDGFQTLLIIGSYPHFEENLVQCAKDENKEITILNSLHDDDLERETFNQTFQSLNKLGFVRKTQTVAPIDLESEEVIKNPYRIYHELQQKGSVHFLEKHGFWIVLNYNDVANGLKQTNLFTNLLGRELDSVLVGADAENHQRVRAMLNPFFSNQAAKKLEDFTRKKSLQLLENAKNDASFEIVKQFSIPLTESVIANLLGLNADEVEFLSDELRAKKYQLGYYDLLTDFFTKHLEVKELGDDLLSSLIKKETLSSEEIISLARLFWVAGTTTTSMLISNSIYHLLSFSPLRRKVQSDFKLIPAFIEESLRLESPEQMAWRVATEDVEIAGTKIKQGAQIMFCLGAANRDSSHFASPNEFRLDRTSKDHLAFAGGAHYCLGAGLARMEARVALESLFNELPNFEENEDLGKIKFLKSFHFRAIESLNVRK